MNWQVALWRLRFDWCPPYRVTTDEGRRWSASWLDEPASGTLTAPTADELRSLIRADYDARTPEERQGWRLPHPAEEGKTA